MIDQLRSHVRRQLASCRHAATVQPPTGDGMKVAVEPERRRQRGVGSQSAGSARARRMDDRIADGTRVLTMRMSVSSAVICAERSR